MKHLRRRAMQTFTATGIIICALRGVSDIVRFYIGRKSIMKKIGLFLFMLTCAACSPEVGSAKWCERMEKKPEGDWSLNEAKDYAKHCLFK